MGVTRRSSSHVGAARRLIDDHEASLDPTTRRTRGVHYTPHDLARMLANRAVDLVEDRLGRLPRTVLDPSCGSGAFLLAVAEVLVERGLDPADVVHDRLVGHDIDPRAVEVARTALATWSGTAMVTSDGHASDAAPEIDVTVRDVLDVDEGVGLGLHDLVIGNPPFLSQLRASTALGPERLEALSVRLGPFGQYVDASAVFLAMGLHSVGPGGIVCLIQPQSFLSNKNAGSVRNLVSEGGGPIQIWSSPFMHFEAQVRVCAVMAGRPDDGIAPGVTPGEDVEATSGPFVGVLWSGERDSVEPTETYRVDAPRRDSSWGFMIAPGLGVPVLPPRSRMTRGPGIGGHRHGRPGRLADLARTTAGFRDEYYQLRDACTEEGDCTGGPGGSARIVTTGLIRPGGCDWGTVDARIGGRKWHRPVVDPMATAGMEPRVHEWLRSRLVPKVLVATQSRVVEACVDLDGSMAPMTPVISVEPIDGWETIVDPDREHDVDLWWLVAALSAPSVSVAALTANLGSGLSVQSLRWSATAVGAVELPTDRVAWAAGAAAARHLERCDPGERSVHLAALGHHMLEAHDLVGADQVFEWWFERACRA